MSTANTRLERNSQNNFDRRIKNVLTRLYLCATIKKKQEIKERNKKKGEIKNGNYQTR